MSKNSIAPNQSPNPGVKKPITLQIDAYTNKVQVKKRMNISEELADRCHFRIPNITDNLKAIKERSFNSSYKNLLNLNSKESNDLTILKISEVLPEQEQTQFISGSAIDSIVKDVDKLRRNLWPVFSGCFPSHI